MNWSCKWVAVGVAVLVISACGFDEDSEDRGLPPPVSTGSSDTLFAIESGTYYVSDVRDVQDGCGKEPMTGETPLTSVPFVVTNDGAGNVAVDFCAYEGRSLQGVVRGNRGTLAVIHSNRKVGSDDMVAEFTQDCRLDLTMQADNRFEAYYVELQTNRNELMRLSTKDVPECTTSFKMVMERRD